jgi:hypothetical protein
MDAGVTFSLATSSLDWLVPGMTSIWLSVRSPTRDAFILCFFLSFFFFRYLCLAFVFCYRFQSKICMRPKLAGTDFWRLAMHIAHLDYSIVAVLK